MLVSSVQPSDKLINHLICLNTLEEIPAKSLALSCDRYLENWTKEKELDKDSPRKTKLYRKGN